MKYQDVPLHYWVQDSEGTCWYRIGSRFTASLRDGKMSLYDNPKSVLRKHVFKPLTTPIVIDPRAFNTSD